MSDCNCDELRKALEECRKTLLEAGACIQNEIACCELSGRSTNAWPDMMTGCVSGGGITNAITIADAALATHKAKEVEYSHVITNAERFLPRDPARPIQKAKEVEYRMLQPEVDHWWAGDECQPNEGEPWERVNPEWIGMPFQGMVKGRRPIQKEAR